MRIGYKIDNNATEREIKALVMARKNVLFSYSVEGAEALGIYFSVIQSARAHHLEPESYLTAVFKMNITPRCYPGIMLKNYQSLKVKLMQHDNVINIP